MLKSKKFVFVLSGLTLGLSYQSCGNSLGRSAGAPTQPESSSLEQAQRKLASMAARTPDSPSDQAFMALLSDSIANVLTREGADSCGCPGLRTATGPDDSGAEGSLSLDDATPQGSQKVGATCDRVRGLANRFVPGDGGCWLRANAACIGGLAQGLDIGKVWIVGAVRDSSGGLWNFHVANVYDGLVYDVGFGLKGVTLEEWQKKFSASTSETKLVVTNCASAYEEKGIKEYENFSDSLIKQICKASGDHGGEAFYRQMSSWIPEAAAQQPGNVMPAGAHCDDLLARVDYSFEEMAKAQLPKFVAQPGVTDECQKKTYFRALASLSDHRKYTYRLSSIKSAGKFGHKISFYFLDPFNGTKTVEVIVDQQCSVKAVL